MEFVEDENSGPDVVLVEETGHVLSFSNKLILITFDIIHDLTHAYL